MVQPRFLSTKKHSLVLKMHKSFVFFIQILFHQLSVTSILIDKVVRFFFFWILQPLYLGRCTFKKHIQMYFQSNQIKRLWKSVQKPRGNFAPRNSSVRGSSKIENSIAWNVPKHMLRVEKSCRLHMLGAWFLLLCKIRFS